VLGIPDVIVPYSGSGGRDKGQQQCRTKIFRKLFTGHKDILRHHETDGSRSKHQKRNAGLDARNSSVLATSGIDDCAPNFSVEHAAAADAYAMAVASESPET